MATWPATLPQKLNRARYSESPAMTTIRTSMDAGPDKVRRRFTAGVRPVQGQILLTETQLDTFKTFYNTTLQGGALRFDWDEPLDDTTAVEMRFTSEPTWTELGPDVYQVRLELEILP